MDVLKQIKCRKCSKFDCASIDFDSIDVCDVMYLSTSFDNNVIFFVLPPLPIGVPSTNGFGMDGMDKIYDGHAWRTTKTTTSITTMGCHSCVQHVQVMCNAQTTFVITSSVMEVLEITLSGQGPLLAHFFVGIVAFEKLWLECKVCHSTHVCLAICFAHILYVHSSRVEMAKICIHLDVCNHHVSHVSCHETLDIVYQFIANKVMKTPKPKKLYNCDGNRQIIYGGLPPHVPYKCLRTSPKWFVLIDGYGQIYNPCITQLS